jgi:hypothetical protein
MKRICCLLPAIAAFIAAVSICSEAGTLPERPRISMQTAYAPPANPTIYKPQTSADFQTALNTCKLGDIIELQAGTIYKGPFTLPNKTSGSGWIYIISGALLKLPAPCKRVSPSDAPNMPVIVVAANAGGAVQTVAGTHHYRFVGIEFRPVDGNYVYNIVQIGKDETSESTLPNHIILDRCYIHGDPIAGSRRGVLLNGAWLAVVDCHISDCKEQGADSQALAGYSTTGPIKIVNNYLEGAGENLMFGGSDPTVVNAVASDIEIRCNYFFKPLKWMQEKWVVKNLLEFKNAQRVFVEGNRFENSWPSGQSGFALLLTPRNQNNSAPWSVVQDITIRRNIFVNIAQGINMLGMDAPNISRRTTRVLIQDNILKAVAMPGGDGRMFQVLGDPMNVSIDHNTGFCPVAYMVSDGTPKTDSFSFTNNIVSQGAYGFIGTGTANANTTLAAFYNNNWTLTHNAVIGGSAANYPAGNFFPATIVAVGFIDTSAGNFRLNASSPYKSSGTDGRDLGADMDSIEKASTYICDMTTDEVQTPVDRVTNTLFPNPADKFLMVETNATDHEAMMITLSDELGREILSIRSTQNTEKINTSELPSGVYILHMHLHTSFRTSKFVVRH